MLGGSLLGKMTQDLKVLRVKNGNENGIELLKKNKLETYNHAFKILRENYFSIPRILYISKTPRQFQKCKVLKAF